MQENENLFTGSRVQTEEEKRIAKEEEKEAKLTEQVDETAEEGYKEIAKGANERVIFPNEIEIEEDKATKILESTVKSDEELKGKVIRPVATVVETDVKMPAVIIKIPKSTKITVESVKSLRHLCEEGQQYHVYVSKDDDGVLRKIGTVSKEIAFRLLPITARNLVGKEITILKSNRDSTFSKIKENSLDGIRLKL